MNNMSQKSLIFISAVFFVVSVGFLFWQNERELDPDRNKHWWTLSFEAPSHSRSLAFMIENHSDTTEFQYSIVADGITLTTSTLEVRRGDTKVITPPFEAQSGTRTRIIVSTNTENKEIYR